MNWRILSHSYKNIIPYLSKLITSSADKINNMRIIYTIDDSNMTYILSAFNFINPNLEHVTIKSVSLCEMVKE